jgi:D-beta-D-heptose 7-phosphate kinase/D-beta-D-heptose 1-phosphate adenosyltransferase
MQIKIPDFSTAKVLIVGDIMLDRYWHGGTSRISPEAPVPVVHVGDSEDRPGGAGNVALNVAALGAHATVIGLTGKDQNADLLEKKLSGAGIKCLFHRVDDYPTVTKLRVMSRHQQLIRLDFEQGFHDVSLQALETIYAESLASHDVVILSDYGKGVLRNSETLIRIARARGIPVLVDPKSNDFAVYRGATLITPNYKEFEGVVGVCRDEAEIVSKGQALLREHALEALLVTRGEHGMSLLREEPPELHLPTQAREVFDVTGAGDTVIATLGASLAAGEPMPESTALANIAAGIVVGKMGTATASVPEIRREIQIEHTTGRGVVSEDQLRLLVEDARAADEVIVMTNGCFDILHPGHVAYLEEAKKLGQRLIVAVNDDDSVMRLKGEGRPINTVASRMAVLAGLASVDWVVPFSEDTPERLICNVLPDILVKGGDYKAEDVAGYDCVRKQGGDVKILNFLDGHSTSRIIEKIQS